MKTLINDKGKYYVGTVEDFIISTGYSPSRQPCRIATQDEIELFQSGFECGILEQKRIQARKETL